MVSRILPHLRDLRQFTNPYAPGFFVVAARATGPLVEHLSAPLYVMGKGENPTIAQLRMCGEAVERISIKADGVNESWSAYNPEAGTGKTIIPADFFSAGYGLRSHGCACHNYLDVASQSAATELWERRAVQDWWNGTSRLRLLTPTHPRFDALQAHVAKTRDGGVEPRPTSFCLIEGDYPVNVALAVSQDRDGGQMALGFAASVGPLFNLFQRAFEELLSVELETADLYRARLDGDAILEGTNRFLVRARQQVLRARLSEELRDCQAINPDRVAQPDTISLQEILRQSEALGARVWLVDQTHEEIGVPTIRAIFADADLNPFIYADENAVLPL